MRHVSRGRIISSPVLYCAGYGDGLLEIAHMNGTCLICRAMSPYEWVMSHRIESCRIWMSHVSYEWGMSRMNESWHTWMGRVSYVVSFLMWMSHVAYEWVTLCFVLCSSRRWRAGKARQSDIGIGSKKSRLYTYVFIHMYIDRRILRIVRLSFVWKLTIV